MKNIILITPFLISLLISGNLVFAAEENSGSSRNFFNEIFQKIDQGIMAPVKQGIKDIPKNIGNGLNRLWERLEEEKRQKQEEIKEEIKQEIKQEIQKSGEKAERKYLTPLKNKIQQGIDKTREIVSGIKDFIINLF